MGREGIGSTLPTSRPPVFRTDRTLPNQGRARVPEGGQSGKRAPATSWSSRRRSRASGGYRRQELTTGQDAGGVWIPYAAAGWALLFSALHIMWAAGWYVALPADWAAAGFSRPWFWWYDVAVAVGCAIGAGVALRFAGRGRRKPRRTIVLMAWCGTGVLAIRSAGSVVQMGYLLAVGRYAFEPMHLYELWFYLGTALFLCTLWRYHRRTASADRGPASTGAPP